MISDEKMTHIVHLMLNEIWKADLVDFPDEETARREAKRVCIQFLSHMNSVADTARKRILSQKNPPVENSSQWETLYHKYYEEEWHRKGG